MHDQKGRHENGVACAYSHICHFLSFFHLFGYQYQIIILLVRQNTV